MKIKLALYNALIGTLCVFSFAAKADSITTVNEATPTYADKQESAVLPQQALFTSTSPRDYAEDRNIKRKFSGFYAGGGVNYARSSSKLKITIIPPTAENLDKSMSSNDPGLNINLGYGHNWGRFYLGGEAFADYMPMNMKAGEKTKVSATYDIGAALKFGLVLFDRAMLYGLVGGSFSELDNSWGDLPSESHTQVGPVLGGGFEYLFTDNWAAKLQYTFASYGDITANTGINGINQAKFDSIDRKIITLGITYHF